MFICEWTFTIIYSLAIRFGVEPLPVSNQCRKVSMNAELDWIAL